LGSEISGGVADEHQSIVTIDIEDEMRSSYIDYSMSVIVSRALPDVRDGLKPVQRRILYGMSELDLGPTRPYKKSARIVGEVLGKYHPHGDSAVYDGMVRMAQDFSMRYMLVGGQGNFGSIDGDSAAAMRYTEARLTRISQELLQDLDKETVDFIPNFDESMDEPTVLPAAVPNLLMNGASGIAVGMATNIPPHNLGELVDATVLLIDNPEATVGDIMSVMPAPDFATGGIIYGYSGVKEAYETGRGRVIMRARIHEETLAGGREALVVTEIPYQVNKASTIEKIALLVREKKIEGIFDLRDESDRDGMRVVIELKKDAVPLVVENQLYKFTQLQQTFGVNMVALVDGRPRTLTVLQAIQYYVAHRHKVLVRRTQFELRKAEERAHILEGLKIALDNLDAVISIIRHSANPDEARENLMKGVIPASLTAEMRERFELPASDESLFELSDVQAKAILELRLQRLTALERQKIEDEHNQILAQIARLNEILGDEGLRMQIIKEELLEIRERHADDRRTEIDYAGGDMLGIEDLIEDEQVVVTITHEGLIKRTAVDTYRQQGRGGKGLRATGKRHEDFVEQLFVTTNHGYLLFFTDLGQCYWQRVFQLPEGTRIGKGRSIRNLIQIDQADRVRAVLAVPKEQFGDPEFAEQHFVLMATKSGNVKKTPLAAFCRPRTNGIIAISINEGDQLLEAKLTDGGSTVVLASSGGRAIRFSESDVRSMGRNTRGVRGMRIGLDEHVVGMIVIGSEEREVLALSKNGYGKRTQLDDYRQQARGGRGVLTLKVTERVGNLVAVKAVSGDDDLMIITQAGIMIRMDVNTISSLGRNTQGVRLINLNEGDAIADVTPLLVDVDDEKGEDGEEIDQGETDVGD
jgi:DNA gyrase subunit A